MELRRTRLDVVLSSDEADTLRMKVRKLTPDPLPEKPPCEAVRITRYANDTYLTDKTCKHGASFVVNGKHYCKRHAEGLVMKLTLKESKP